MATSIKLPPQLSARIARVAKARGISSHAFMLETLAEGTDAAERRAAFVRDALSAEAEAKRTGRSYDGDEVLAWFQARAQGKRPSRPRPKRS